MFGTRVGAGDDHEVLIGPCSCGSGNLGGHDIGVDNLLVLHMAALLGQDLILDMDASDAGPFVLLHGADHIDLVAVAGVGICNHREVDRRGDASGIVDHFGHAQQPDVRTTEQRCRCAEAGHVHSSEVGLFDQPGTEGVVTTWQHERLLCFLRSSKECS